MTSSGDAVADLLHLLDLETLDEDLYRGAQPPSGRERVYGGQVAAQALVAGVRSVDPEFVPHSFHSYFLLPGDYSVPIIFDVQRLRDGRSFLTRRVTAKQHGRPIYHQTINFQKPEEGFEHQDVMPEVPGPEQGVDLVELMRGAGNADADELGKEWGSLDVRFLGNSRHGLEPDPHRPSRAQSWVRFREGLPGRPDHPPGRVHLRQRHQPARRLARRPRREPVQGPDGLARPHDLVPPALPGRRVVALRPVVARRLRRSRAVVRRDLHHGRHPRRDRGAGGHDPPAPPRPECD